jgi:O-antigen ligase
MMSVIFVPLFWNVMHRRGKSTSLKGIMYTAALLLSLYYLLITQSRGAMLTTAFTAACYFFSTSSSRRSKILATSSLVLMVSFLTIPNFGEFVYQKFIIKGSGTDISGSWELSRASIFEATWAGAEGGAFFGGGYGISIGSDPSAYSGGFTSVGYGREKGNAILAVIEETGLIGLLILLSMFIHFFTKARSAYKKSREKLHKTTLALLVGYVVGMLIMSNFEAWLVSPGSPESLFFWGYLGVIYGLCLRIIRDHDYSVGVDVINGRKYA